MDYSIDVKVIRFLEIPEMFPIKELLEKTLPGWSFSDLFCPGKAYHYTFLAKKDNEYKLIYIHETTHEIQIEELNGRMPKMS